MEIIWELVEVARLLEAHLLWHDSVGQPDTAMGVSSADRRMLAKFFSLAAMGNTVTDTRDKARQALNDLS